MPPADRPQEPQSLADKLRAEHYEFAPTGYPSYCDGCGEAWPCAVSLVLDLLRATCQ